MNNFSITLKKVFYIHNLKFSKILLLPWGIFLYLYIQVYIYIYTVGSMINTYMHKYIHACICETHWILNVPYTQGDKIYIYTYIIDHDENLLNIF